VGRAGRTGSDRGRRRRPAPPSAHRRYRGPGWSIIGSPASRWVSSRPLDHSLSRTRDHL